MKTWRKRLAAGLLTLVLGVSLVPGAFAASAYDCPGQKLAALTFDDGPGRYSAAILDTLKAHGAKDTFFMNGYNIWIYASQVQRMVAEGHQVANHTYNHPDLVQSSDALVRQEVDSLAQALTQITGLKGTGNTSFYLRPPFGSRNQRVLSLAGTPVVCWSVDSSDWKYRDANHLVSYVSSQTRDGDIILVHETVPSTAQGLDRLLTQLQSQGFELVTVEELFWRRGITPQAGKLYFSAQNTGVNRCAKALYFDESKLDTHWAYPAISFALEQGFMSKNQYGEFTPNFPLTRGMFVTALGRLAGGTAEEVVPSGFTDIPIDHYAAPYVTWAKETGIMNGVSADTFGVNSPLTRQQMAAALARYARYQGAQPGAFDLNTYSDSASIAAWAREDVADCSALGLLNGSDGAFRPEETTTRAMGAAILQRLARYPWPEIPTAPDVPTDPDVSTDPNIPSVPETPTDPDTTRPQNT